MIHSRESWEEFLKEAKEKDWGIPPAHEIQFPNHYWLRTKHGKFSDVSVRELKVAQWSPSERTWYNSNELATIKKPLDYLLDWEVMMRVDLPPMEGKNKNNNTVFINGQQLTDVQVAIVSSALDVYSRANADYPENASKEESDLSEEDRWREMKELTKLIHAKSHLN